jgi:hypothetical protein
MTAEAGALSPPAATAYGLLAAHRAQVEAMAGFGVPEAGIAQVLEINPATLRSCYAKELDNGGLKANARVAENLYRKATGDGREAVVAAIFWLKTRAGWKETALHEISGRGGAPIETVETNSADIAKVLLAIIHRNADHCEPDVIDA